MAYLKAVVATPVGTFEGFANVTSGSHAELVETRDTLQARIDSLETFTLFESVQEPDLKQITFPGTILRNSVIVFEIV
jgi:hypothetical protein